MFRRHCGDIYLVVAYLYLLWRSISAYPRAWIGLEPTPHPTSATDDVYMSNIMTDDENTKLKDAIILLLDNRGEGKTICPSEASRAVFGSSRGNDADKMRRTRDVVRELVDAGRIEVCQRGEVVDMATCKGPIRLRKKNP